MGNSMRLLIGAAAICTGLLASAQPTEPTYRVGAVFNTPMEAELTGNPPSLPIARAFVEGLRELGWVDGKNVRIIWRSGEGDFGRTLSHVQQLVDQGVDVLVVNGERPAIAARERSKSIPIVVPALQTPVDSGLVRSLGRPGTNVTGIALASDAEIYGKRLQLLKQVSPRVSRVAYLYNLAGPGDITVPEALAAAATRLDLEILAVPFAAPGDLPAAFENARRRSANAVLVADVRAAFVPGDQRQISDLALKHRLPVMHGVPQAADNGGLLAYGADLRWNWRRAARYVDRILKGKRPDELPIEQANRIEFVINKSAARAIGLNVPASLLGQADRVIE